MKFYQMGCGKGVLSREFCCAEVSSVLKSLFGSFTRTQNVPADLQRRYQTKFGREKPVKPRHL